MWLLSQIRHGTETLTDDTLTMTGSPRGLRLLRPLQTTLLHFWEKTSHTMAAIHESFKGSQHHEASALKVREGSRPAGGEM